MTRAPLLAGLAALSSASPVALAAPPPSYTVTDLGTLGGAQSLAAGLNDAGQAVGTADLPGDARAHGFLFSYDPAHPPATLPAAPLVDLGTLGGANSGARAISGAGQVAGYADTAAGGSHAFLYTPGSGLTDLGTLGGGVSVAFGLGGGAAPLIVGGAETGAIDGLSRPIGHALAAGGTASTLQDLGVLPNYFDSAANGVSVGGKIVGTSYDLTGLYIDNSLATLFTPGAAPVSLGALTPAGSSDAYAATDTLAVGDATDSTGAFVPVTFSLSPAGTVTRLGLLSGYANGVAYGVNAAGAVVGVGYNGAPASAVAATGAAEHAFLYTAGALYDLNGLITTPASSTVLEAFGVNAYGQIVGDGLTRDGALHALLLAPTPTVTGLSRNAAAPGASFPLTVTGTNFAPDAVVYYNGVPESTTFASPTQVTATIAAAGIAGTATVDVGTPTPGGDSQALDVGVTTTISGTLTLQGWLGTGEPTPALTFVLTPTGGTPGGPVVTTLTPTPAAAPSVGPFAYALTGVAPGTYVLNAKGPLWLRQGITVDTTGGAVSGADMTLPGGDANNDNLISIRDILTAESAYRTSAGSPGFNPNADVNGDGVVTIRDVLLPESNYAKQGVAVGAVTP